MRLPITAAHFIDDLLFYINEKTPNSPLIKIMRDILTKLLEVKDPTGQLDIAIEIIQGLQKMSKENTLLENTNKVDVQLFLAFCKFNGIGMPAMESEALAEISTIAKDKLHPIAQYYTGLLLLDESRIFCDAKRGFESLLLAAGQNYPNALFFTAECFEKGEGTEKDIKKSFELYLQAADKYNHEGSALAVGYFYKTGIPGGLPADPFLARKYFQIAADKQFSAAQYALAECLEQGIGGKVDLEAAFLLYQAAAKVGDKDAQYAMGLCLEQGRGVKQDTTYALECYVNAAESGHEQAIHLIAKHGKEVKKQAEGLNIKDNRKVATLTAAVHAKRTHIRLAPGEVYEESSLDYPLDISGASGNSVHANYTNGTVYAVGKFKTDDLSHLLSEIEKLPIKTTPKPSTGVVHAETAVDTKSSKEYCVSNSSEAFTNETIQALKNSFVDSNYIDTGEIPDMYNPTKSPKARFVVGECYMKGIYVKADPAFACAWYETAANQGSEEAQIAFAECLASGNGVSKDPRRALEYYRKAASLGNLGAIFVLQENGEGESDKIGEHYFSSKKSLAAYSECLTDRKDAKGLYRLGLYYAAGQNVSKDLGKAFECFKKATEKNYPPALYATALCYFSGHGVVQDIKEAFDYFSRSCAHIRTIGDVESLDPMSSISSKVEFFRDHIQTQMMKLAREKNVVSGAGAYFTVGATAITDENLSSEDQKRAIAFLEHAVDMKHSGAAFFLGMLYLNGDFGIKVNLARGIKLHLLCASLGDPWGEYSIAQCLMADTLIPADFKKAAELLQAAANKGYSLAQNELGVLYAEGHGVIRDLNQALKFFQAAIEQDQDAATDNIEKYCYANGIGLSEGPEEIEQWLSIEDIHSNDRNHLHEKYLIALCYYDGRRVPENLQRALFWLRKIVFNADPNVSDGYLLYHADAEAILGNCYLMGNGVEANAEEALERHKRAALKGSAEGLYQYGFHFADNNDWRQANHYWRKSAEKGHREAQYELGRSYAASDYARYLTQDWDKACYWFKAAMDQEHPKAEYALKICVERGGQVSNVLLPTLKDPFATKFRPVTRLENVRESFVRLNTIQPSDNSEISPQLVWGRMQSQVTNTSTQQNHLQNVNEALRPEQGDSKRN